MQDLLADVNNNLYFRDTEIDKEPIPNPLAESEITKSAEVRIMGTRNERIDAYIAKSEGFAKPILHHLRDLVHKACPEVEEKMKWSFPHFDYKGKMMCSMASFKNHCAFGFWKASIMQDKNKVMSKGGEAGMGQFGRIASLSYLPSDKILIEYIKEAARLNDEGITVPSKPKKEKKELKVPAYFLDAVSKKKRAIQTFRNFSYSNQKDYVEWVTEAKSENTRQKRLKTTVKWLAEGKPRNWKYMKKY